MTGTLVERARPDGCEAPTSAAARGVRTFRAIGTSATVAVTRPELADRARDLLAEELRRVDAAYSRFRHDSELRRLERAGAGRPVPVSPLLYEALDVACAVAERTAGIVDPTIGSAVVELGYDRDFDQLDPRAELPALRAEPAPGWWRIGLDAEHSAVTVPPGVHIDLGSSGKAFAADRAARHIATSLGCGVLVNLGGDISVSGPAPADGWAIGIASSCTAPVDAVDQVVTVVRGGLATSGTTARTWFRDGRQVHHIVDPWTGEAASTMWALVSTTGRNCVEANAWSTAAVVWGEDAPGNLRAQGVAARLVRSDGSVVHVGGWPDDRPSGDGADTGTAAR
jgi:thiamine biosynthesis lipoprotein